MITCNYRYHPCSESPTSGGELLVFSWKNQDAPVLRFCQNQDLSIFFRFYGFYENHYSSKFSGFTVFVKTIIISNFPVIRFHQNHYYYKFIGFLVFRKTTIISYFLVLRSLSNPLLFYIFRFYQSYWRIICIRKLKKWGGSFF